MTARTPSGVPLGTMAVLLAGVFTVSIGFGVVLPLLPYVIERLLGSGGSAVQVSRSTGLLTGLYMLALFLFAPMWGRVSDKFGRRPILLVGLIGFAATTLGFAFIDTLTAIYVERFLSGVFAAAVTPVALATVGDLAVSEDARGRRLTIVSLAGIIGFLLGPMLGVFIGQGAASLLPVANVAGSLAYPLAGTALLSLVVAAAVAVAMRGMKRADPAPRREMKMDKPIRWLVARLFAISAIVSAAVGVFEVGLALRGKQQLGLTQYEIAMMFTTCSLVMIVVQAAVFSPWVKPTATRWLIAPALAILAVGLFLVPRASDFTLMLIAIGVVAASAGILSPILTYWISSKAGHKQGAELGKQTAAASLGSAVGSAAGGLLFDIPLVPNASFLLVSGLVLIGVFISINLPKLLIAKSPSPGMENDRVFAAVAKAQS